MDWLFELHRREGEYERYLLHFIIPHCNCFSIVESPFFIIPYLKKIEEKIKKTDSTKGDRLCYIARKIFNLYKLID